jgi:hypothetical protein
MLRRCVRWIGLLVLAAPACGSGGHGDGTPFTPTTPVADACSMLALADVQVLVPGATAGTTITPENDSDTWMRGCSWQAGGLGVSLIVEGALTSTGDLVLGVALDDTSNANRTAMAVAGVGDKAVYIDNIGLDQLFNAKKGGEIVSVGAYGFTQPVAASSLQPLAVEALSKL